MLIKNVETVLNGQRKIGAILITRSDDIIEYSAMISDDKSHLETEEIIGMSLFDAYPSLEPESSTHRQVLRSGKPIINVIQTVVDYKGRKEKILTSTFPIESNGRVIATFDISSEIETKNPVSVGRELHNVDDIISADKEMDELKYKIKKLALTESSVMIVGESGTGKQLVAESLHTMSKRHNKSFISLNCAAIPETLLDSTLFGTVKGAFTGAEHKKGLFELADKGTLFLDEANSMSLELQAKLLKAVEDKQYYKVGGEKSIEVDVRIISAMNQEPIDAVNQGIFRRDLFYRLGVIQLTIPPLRERRRDILALTDYYIEKYNEKMNRNIDGVSSIAQEAIMRYKWPGNIRELKNTIEYAFSVSDTNEINLIDLPDYILDSVENTTNDILAHDILKDIKERGIGQIIDEYEKKLIIEILSESSTLAEVASKTKLTRQAIKYKIEKYRIDYK